MTQEEVHKLHEIFRQKYVDLDRTPEEFWKLGSREGAWDRMCEDLGIERISKLLHLVLPESEGEIRLQEPNTDRYMKIPEETARKILVLGLP